ncbi:complement C1q tumor necrosis factor-related protein 5-like [Xenopus laevis]|uniref:Complement C1q tumor necrosis factor-related protein 5-like n=1 Tax=Xenopus laevis TaxID=8355 RepID=A0A8J1LAK4_XENLA|nr:complement C1q tumor necrosis factor-related protein 5-like [Xenopus laevis]
MIPLLHLISLITLIPCSSSIEDNKIASSCCGTPGIPGIPGTHGNAGLPGRDGRDEKAGSPGTSESKGDTWSTGIPGARGFPGMASPSGLQDEKGVQGKCAVSSCSAFSAKLSESRTSPIPGQPVPFEKVLINEQGHYKPETGCFHCVVRGLLYFFIHGTVFRGSLHLQPWASTYRGKWGGEGTAPLDLYFMPILPMCICNGKAWDPEGEGTYPTTRSSVSDWDTRGPLSVRFPTGNLLTVSLRTRTKVRDYNSTCVGAEAESSERGVRAAAQSHLAGWS